MALPEITNANTATKTEKKQHENPKHVERKEKPLTKVIIRRLPPNIDQETFLNQVSPVPNYDYIYTVKGDRSLGENAFSRVYINFTKAEDVYSFKEKFDNYVFIDNRGHEYPAVVEFAAFQKIPKKRNKNRVDPKCGTMETDPIYLEFVESLNKHQEPDTKAEYSYQITTENKPNEDVSTPLLEYIKNKRAERLRIREERREERKRKELERKKIREDERRRRYEEKSPIKSVVIKPHSLKSSPKESKAEGDGEKSEKDSQEVPLKSATFEKSSHYKNKEKKFSDRRDVKPKYGRKEYPERREYKSRRDDYKDRDYKERDYRSKYDEKRDNEVKSSVKKVKKYSEKREERRVEAQKAEQKKVETSSKSGDTNLPKDTTEKPKEVKPQKNNEVLEETGNPASNPNGNIESKTSDKDTEKKKDIDKSKDKGGSQNKDKECSQNKDKENNNSSQKRIRNKDRPTLAIYRPGMLSKRKQPDGDNENKESKKE